MTTDPIPAPALVVLLVEDEVLVRMVAADILIDAGFHVIETVNAAEALTVLKVRDDITAVVTDVNMPGGLSGLELAAVVASRDPGMAIVVTSGREWPIAGELPDGAVFENKPFTSASLVNAVRRAIEEKAATRMETLPEAATSQPSTVPAEDGTGLRIVLAGKLAS